MNFDTPPQALTICGEWNKILKIPCRCCWSGGAARRAGNVPAEVKGNYADGKDKEVKPEIVGTVES